MELAEKNFDYLWMMDDDGYPSENCLEQLVNSANNNHYDYLMPVSIDIDNFSQLSWAVRKKTEERQ